MTIMRIDHAMTAPFVVIVDFRLVPGAREPFRHLVDKNAADSVANEPGCHRFDVLEVDSDDNRILLYEIYEDRAAFEAHLASDHFTRFNAESASFCVEKHVIDCSLALSRAADLGTETHPSRSPVPGR